MVRKPGVKARIRVTEDAVQQEISAYARDHGNTRYGGGLASEGYAGDYAAALSDVLLLLSGSQPCVQPRYWRRLND